MNTLYNETTDDDGSKKERRGEKKNITFKTEYGPF